MLLHHCNYIIDAIDTIKAKVCLIHNAIDLKIPIINSMGVGNRLDPTKFKIGNIFETQNCPFSRIIRKELRKKNIKNLKVVYSTETPKKCFIKSSSGKTSPGSISFLPAIAGLIIAGEVIKDLLD